MKFNHIEKLILFGGSRILTEFAYFLKRNISFDIVVFSSKRHLSELVPGKKITLGVFLKKNKIRFYNSENINKDKKLKKEVTPNSLGIAFGASWVFEKPTVLLFKKNHLLDFMGIDLPRYRGGAHYTWQILHENRQGCVNLQIVDGGNDTFHKGEILNRENFTLPKELKTPLDFFDFISKKETDFLEKFLDDLKSGKDFKPQRIDESKSSYYPFLNAKMNGFIDWSWSGKDIYLFINAFSDPYAGASTFVNGKRVFLKNCRLLKEEEKYHPFSAGIVVRKDKNSIYIASRGNLLAVEGVLNVSVGDRFFTPSTELDKAVMFKTIYVSSGLKNNK